MALIFIMLSNLTEDEQKTIRKNYVRCSRWTFTQRCNEDNNNKIIKCVEDQKNIPKIIHAMICYHTNLIKPISQMIIQYIGPPHSYFFELILNDFKKIINPLLHEPRWMHSELCPIIRYYDRICQSWNLPLIDSKSSNNDLNVLIRYNVNVNMNANTLNDVKIMDFMKGVAELLSSDDGFNFPKYSCSDPLTIAVHSPFEYNINPKKIRKKNAIPQKLQQSNQQKYQQKLMKITTIRLERLNQHNQHNKKYNIVYKKSNNQKRSYKR